MRHRYGPQKFSGTTRTRDLTCKNLNFGYLNHDDGCFRGSLIGVDDHMSME
ncbi:hypothetical protein HanIR_Chr17g0890381 [Helianthus annuus]|nr:hypothetical protein HanIR_Chr17g0890381 [Helianthus annuus]